ncbi:RNA polymerase II elongation factor [Apophysomyces sp. BC1034]|nr:RNA polymerase II elongation factor [Apophysomyces sp. BC1015]KAG0177973.1 RNA polymerase II elongation factor [Apophysomyces sp. BC1021]KAG0177982.1 RNA polymerase II elongation factor [Apophysomyces sp. BC1021]KAG0185113.1 RNA polymerase II elongation factor [Apophysomyces sp. BC1034]
MDPIRSKSIELLNQSLSDTGHPQDALAKAIEQEIYWEQDQKVNDKYKAAVRTHVFNLKDRKNPLRQKLISGQINPTHFAHMSASEMATADRRAENELLRRSSIFDSMGIDDLKPRERDLDDPEPSHDH